MSHAVHSLFMWACGARRPRRHTPQLDHPHGRIRPRVMTCNLPRPCARFRIGSEECGFRHDSSVPNRNIVFGPCGFPAGAPTTGRRSVSLTMGCCVSRPPGIVAYRAGCGRMSRLSSTEPASTVGCGLAGMLAPAPITIHRPRGCSSMVELQLPKLTVRVRFPSPAPTFRSRCLRVVRRA